LTIDSRAHPDGCHQDVISDAPEQKKDIAAQLPRAALKAACGFCAISLMESNTFQIKKGVI
jgi:hypothetical protein